MAANTYKDGQMPAQGEQTSNDAAVITGAIFDCDGTLVDSMPMWNSLVEDIFDAHGIPKTPELLAEAEAYNFDDMCFWLHERFGIGKSGEEVLKELRAVVQDHYVNDIPLFDGCKEFLCELRDAGVRMIILSATTEPEVRVALAAHGIEDFFDRVIQTSETGSDKEHPQAYWYALEALGTPQVSTWVFEDAPFAVKTAHDVGFKTVCLFNDHDGRDFEFCKRNCDILAHGYRELSLALLTDYAVQVAEPQGTLRALVVDGSPQPSTSALVARMAAQSDYVIAADRGAQACREAGVVPHMFCGDADSLDEDTLKWVQASPSAEIRYPEEKYATDLALAVACARHEAARKSAGLRLYVTCASGGRPDHALAVLGCLLEARDAGPCVVEDEFECRILSPEGQACWRVGERDGATGATLSAIPLTTKTVFSEQGMRWNLDHRELPPLADEGISNIVMRSDACVTCHKGALAVYLLLPAKK
ncbi:MAG: thiamine diphosphokinase [Atopobiaceae bacterium]|nr:thiamine diphosphokinase [Atopobiaceae bacterium]